MQEQILIAPNGTELLRTMARYRTATLGLRVMRPAELAKLGLMRSGIVPAETLITPDTEAALIFRFLREIPYFASASYHDAQNLAATLHTLRLQITGDERACIAERLKDSPFREKNAALLAVYDRYTAALREQNLTDTAGIIRLAAADAEPLGTVCSVLREFPLAPLEQALAARLSAGEPRLVSVRELLHVPEQAMPMPQITEAYGAASEAEFVIGTVFREKLPLDQCTVALTDPGDAQLLFELAARFGIPVTFGCGLPVTLSNPAAVLRDYRSWLTGGHCGIDALRALLTGAAFDTKQFCQDHGIERLDDFIRIAGSMRLGADPGQNAARIAAYQPAEECDRALIPQLSSVFSGDGMQCAELIRRYARIRKNSLGRLDSAAKTKIGDALERFTAMTGAPAESLFPELLQARICAENSREGALHVTTVSGALTALRPNLFVMGLSSEKFPGEPTENYLLLDDELAAFGEAAPTSRNLIRQAQNALHDLLMTAAALQIRTELSCCCYDAAELKANNASSALYALFREAGGKDEAAFRASVKRVGYFTQNLPGMTQIGRAYLAGGTVAAELAAPPEAQEITGMLRNLSPSKIETYLACPKRFCYENVMGLRITEPDDVFTVVSARDFGTLVHKAMEFLCGDKPGQAEFLANAGQVFEHYLTERPPMNPNDADKDRQDFMQTVTNGYEAAEEMQIQEAEQELTVTYGCGITVKGRPDALALMPDGTCRILDYKTGRRLRHEENDVFSCIQVMLYADMLTRSGVAVSGGDYRYLRLNKSVSCEYTPERAALIEQKLGGIAEAMQQNRYPASASRDNCQYCPYRGICEEGGAVSC
ncbi:MAG: PD-(D/E)XK nuclease family protein [Oscillospiraceae bacterium]|nr:PD-(D/E)XK nuclease family protein [Oscillospiraceae bacterium]